ncbi:MAG TPA: TRAP transporter small permease [Hyphomicrobiaceae bacterium]|jgi:TRAP-type C4-dicarboxylate transport system permease small subunit|nr:TRAP transporter small permease [Hyphomicrobiaceae bacterium]
MIDRMQALVEVVARYCAVVAGVCLMAIVALTVLNIVTRKFMWPILGAHEATEYLGALLIGLTLAYNQLKKENISVEIVDNFLPARVRALLESVTSFLCLLLCVLIAWRCIIYAIGLWESKEVSLTLGIPFYPFAMIVGASFALLALTLLIDSIRAAAEVRR